jgi:hypothetical protein
MANETMIDGRSGFPAESTIGHRLMDHPGRKRRLVLPDGAGAVGMTSLAILVFLGAASTAMSGLLRPWLRDDETE